MYDSECPWKEIANNNDAKENRPQSKCLELINKQEQRQERLLFIFIIPEAFNPFRVLVLTQHHGIGPVILLHSRTTPIRAPFSVPNGGPSS